MVSVVYTVANTVWLTQCVGAGSYNYRLTVGSVKANHITCPPSIPSGKKLMRRHINTSTGVMDIGSSYSSGSQSLYSAVNLKGIWPFMWQGVWGPFPLFFFRLGCLKALLYRSSPVFHNARRKLQNDETEYIFKGR